MERDPATSVPRTEPESFSGTQSSSLSTIKVPSEYKTAGMESFRGPRDKTREAVKGSSDSTETASPVRRKLRSKSSVSINNTEADISHDLQNIQLSTPRRHASTTKGMVVPVYQNLSAAECETPCMRPKISPLQRKITFGSWRKSSDIRSSTPSRTGTSPPPSSSDSGEVKHERRQMKSKSSVTPFTRVLEKSSTSKVSQDTAGQAKASVSHFTCASLKMNFRSSTLDQKGRIHSSSSSISSYEPFQNEVGKKSDYHSKRGKHPKSSVSVRSPSDDEYICDGARTRSSVTHVSGPVQMSSDEFTSYGKKAKCSVTDTIEMSGKFSSNGKKVKSSFAEATQLPTVFPAKKMATNKSRLHAKTAKSSISIFTTGVQSSDSAYAPVTEKAEISSFNDRVRTQADAERTKTSISSVSGLVEMHDDVNMNNADRTKTSISSVSGQVEMHDDVNANDADRTKTSISSVSGQVEMHDDVNVNDADRTKTSISGPVQMLANVDVHDSEGTKKSVSMSSGARQIATDRHRPDAHVMKSSVTSPDSHPKGSGTSPDSHLKSSVTSPDSHLKRSVDVQKSDTIRSNLLVTSHVDPIQTVGIVNVSRSSISSFTSSPSGQVQTAIEEYLPEIDKSKNLVSLSTVPIQTREFTPSKLDRPAESQKGSDFQKKAKASIIIESLGDAGNKNQSSISTTKRPSPKSKQAADDVISEQRSVKSSAAVTVSHGMKDDDNIDFPQKPPSKKKALSKSRKELTAEQDHDVEESSLFHLMCADTLSVQTIVADWVESYKENRQKALLALLQFVLDAACCKGKITAAMLQPLDGEELVDWMSSKLDKSAAEKIGHQLMRSDRNWKTFSLNLELFIQLLVKLCQNSIIYDQFLLDNLTNLLLAMTSSLVRVFRYIGSFIALKLMTALLDLNGTVKTNINHTLRQIDVARSSAKRNSERLEVLMDKEQELQENLDELEQVFSFYYKAMFKERYRDVAPLIRSMCIMELGEWMKKVPEKFVHDAHLRYVGWLLQDPMGDVRFTCLQVLRAVYKVENLKPRLVTFTCKFKGRFLLMTLDKRIDVSVLAIEIYGFIYKFFPEFREENDLRHMYDLMFSKHRTIAHAAGVFISNTIAQLPCPLSEKTKHGKLWPPNTPFIYKVVKIFVESKMEKYGAYLVDSLIETNEALRDWECMTDLLLEEPDNENDALTDLEENSLISILLNCIQQSISRTGLPGREISVKTLSKKERKQIHDDKINITEHFIEKLPILLTKYENDAENLQRLLSIPQYLELDMYTTPRKDQYLDKLLDKLRAITERHHSKEVLESCIKTLEMLCNPTSATSLRGTVMCNRIIDTIFAKYKDANKEFQSSIDADELPSEDQVFTMTCCAKKVAMFYDHFDLSVWHVWDNFFPFIQDVREDNTLVPEEMIQHCIWACYLSLLWNLREVSKPEKRDDPIMDEVKALRSRLEMLINNLKKLMRMSLKNCKEEELHGLTESIPNQLMRYMIEGLFHMKGGQAFITICDLLIIFKDGGIIGLNPNLLSIEYTPSRDLQLELLQIVEEVVFSEENKEAESEVHCNMLACFIKLFLYNVIPLKAAANILVHYSKPYSKYGELMKQALDKLLLKNRKNCSYVLILALKIAFTELLSSEKGIRQNKQGYSNLMELAKNLTKVFEEDMIKNREAVVNLHIAGINVALEPLQEDEQIPQTPPDSLIFLEILTNVTHILLPQDGRSIVKYLDQEIASLHLPNRGRDWPLQTYRSALVHLKVKKPIQPPAAKKGRSEKSNITESGSEDEREARRQEELIVTNESDERLHLRSSKTPPSSRRGDSGIKKRRLPVKVTRHPSGQLRHQLSLPESPVMTISDIPEISGTLIHPSSTPYVQH